MSVSWDRAKGRWRFFFRRVVETGDGRRRVKPVTKLLPAGWDRATAEKYDRSQTAELYAVASGIKRQGALIETAVLYYITQRCPDLKNGEKVIQELAHLLTYYEGKTVDVLGDVADTYRKDHPDLAPATVRNRLSYLRAACRYTFKFNPAFRKAAGNHKPELYTPKVNNERQVYLTITQQERFWKAFDDDESRALFTLAYYVGARWRVDLLPPRGPQDIKRTGRDVWLDLGVTKNGKRKMKYVNVDVRWALKYMPFERDWRNDYYEAFLRARVKAGLDNLGIDKRGKVIRLVAHDQRHSLASKIISEGGTLSDVQGALGQDSPISANRYAHLYDGRVKSVLQKAGRKKR